MLGTSLNGILSGDIYLNLCKTCNHRFMTTFKVHELPECLGCQFLSSWNKPEYERLTRIAKARQAEMKFKKD